jgi:hypothetical protein
MELPVRSTGAALTAPAGPMIWWAWPSSPPADDGCVGLTALEPTPVIRSNESFSPIEVSATPADIDHRRGPAPRLGAG